MSTPPRLVTQHGTFALRDMTVKYNVASKENWGKVGAHDSRIETFSMQRVKKYP